MSLYYADYNTYGFISSVNEFITLINTALTTAGWTQHYVVSSTPATFDITYKSTGEDGVSALYIRISRHTVGGDDGLGFRAYSFANTVGNWFNLTGDNLGVTFVAFKSWPDYIFCLRCDKNELVMYWLDMFYAIDEGYVWFGQTSRALPATMSGKAFSTANVSAGSSVAIPVDRDLRGLLRPGQTIHIISQDNNVGTGDGKEVCLLAGVTASQVTVKTLANNYDDGALVGLNPMPVFVASQGDISTTPTCYFIFDQDLARASATGQSTVPRPLVRTPALDIYDQGLDTYPMFPIYFKFSETIFGTSYGVKARSGTQNISGRDRFLVGNGGTADRYVAPMNNSPMMSAPDANFYPTFGPGIPA